MRRIMVFVLAFCLLLLPGCGGTEETYEEVFEEISAVDFEDTFWIASEFTASESDGESDEIYAMPNEGWNVDLILYGEGTARFRSVKNYSYTEGSEIFTDAAWSVDEKEKLLTISVFDSDEKLTAQLLDGKLYLDGYDGMFTMEQGEMPENGAEWSPADLEGYWELESSEIEGYEASAEELGMEGGISFYAADTGLIADYYTINEYGDIISVVGDPVVYLEESLHEGCENEHWVVSFMSEDGTSEYYATIINRDKLRMIIFTYAEGYEYPFAAVQNFIWQGGETGMVG